MTHAISGQLWSELSDGTQLGSGWGYGETTEVDLEVERMVKEAVSVKRGFGHSFKMTGSREAWEAIRKYAAERAYMEQSLAGDFDANLGRRLQEQADRIAAWL